MSVGIHTHYPNSYPRSGRRRPTLGARRSEIDKGFGFAATSWCRPWKLHQFSIGRFLIQIELGISPISTQEAIPSPAQELKKSSAISHCCVTAMLPARRRMAASIELVLHLGVYKSEFVQSLPSGTGLVVLSPFLNIYELYCH